MGSRLSRGKNNRLIITLCGRTFHTAEPRYFPQADHHQRRIILCTQVYLEAILVDPWSFYRSHRNAEHNRQYVSLL